MASETTNPGIWMNHCHNLPHADEGMTLRLARRVPSLRRADLDVVDAALAELVESLILARLGRAGPDDVALLARLFDPVRQREVEGHQHPSTLNL